MELVLTWTVYEDGASSQVTRRGFLTHGIADWSSASYGCMDRAVGRLADITTRRWGLKITILSPHRDDAAFSVGLAVQTWLRAGHAVEVVNCFTRSEYSPFGDLAFVHANDRRSYVTALRHREDVLWSSQYKPKVLLADLNLRDGPQRRQCSVEEVCGLPVDMKDGALEKIGKALERRRDRLDALVLPLAIGDHVDHVTARAAAVAMCGTQLPVAFYEDLPYAARPGAAAGIEARVEELASAVGDLRAVFADEAGEVEARVARKRRLALCYDSQIDSEITDSIANFCVRYNGRERLWANDAWQESALKGAAS